MTTDLLNRLKDRKIPHSIVALESFRDDPRDQVENLLVNALYQFSPSLSPDTIQK